MRALCIVHEGLLGNGVALALRAAFPDASVVTCGAIEDVATILSEGAPFDVVLLDIEMRGVKGASTVRWMAETAHGATLMVLSSASNEHDIRDMITAGARGYVLKSSTAHVLCCALQLVLAGATYLAVPRGGEPTERSSGTHSLNDGSTVLLSNFTARERETLRALAEGYTNKEIALRLGIMQGTVKVHVRDIIRKLGVRNRTQAAVIATQHMQVPLAKHELGVQVGPRRSSDI